LPSKVQLKYSDVTLIWLENPFRPNRRVVAPKGSVSVTLASYYSLQSKATGKAIESGDDEVKIYLGAYLTVAEIQYEFEDPELKADKEYVLIVREDTLG